MIPRSCRSIFMASNQQTKITDGFIAPVRDSLPSSVWIPKAFPNPPTSVQRPSERLVNNSPL